MAQGSRSEGSVIRVVGRALAILLVIYAGLQLANQKVTFSSLALLFLAPYAIWWMASMAGCAADLVECQRERNRLAAEEAKRGLSGHSSESSRRSA